MNEGNSAVHAKVSFVVPRGVVRAAVCVSFSAKNKSVLVEFLLLCARDGEAVLMLHKRMHEQKELVSVCELFAGAVAVRRAKS